ncbi:phospholipase B1, membrane-associated-like [Mya arenaria]|uniref:phospholipase B1, membrane-associated-like n=1 Tax=Mya arenaria TaxID=6604 RepID=UPI0022E3F725|nr:phospholipase B1, membrane-associated-like [Mya arenaria]
MWKVMMTIVAFCALAEARLNMMERMKLAFEYVQSNETLMEMYRERVHMHQMAVLKHNSRQRRTTAASFLNNCVNSYQKSSTPPTSVNDLRPEDITIVAALGDSLTAGNGILGTNILDCMKEYRGRSWSIGGDESFQKGVQTLPNILKLFKREGKYLQGASLGLCDTSNLGCSIFNVAVAGQTSQELPAQATELVTRLKSTYFGVDYLNEWKIITLFIGGNDLCEYCHDTNKYSPDSYIAKINETLKILYDNVPKAFVNLVEIFDITPLAGVSQGFFCNLVTDMVCDCAKNNNNHDMLSIISKLYQTKTQNLISTGIYNDKSDFAVTLQPFFRDTTPVKTTTGAYDLNYFAPDCFHFSELGTYAAGKSLWNNMIEPIGMKQTSWHLDGDFECPPNTGPVFKTNRN